MTIKEFIDFGWDDSHAGYDLKGLLKRPEIISIDGIGIDKNKNLILYAGNTQFVYACTVLSFIHIHYTQMDIREYKIMIKVNDTTYDIDKILVNGIDEEVGLLIKEDNAE